MPLKTGSRQVVFDLITWTSYSTSLSRVSAFPPPHLPVNVWSSRTLLPVVYTSALNVWLHVINSFHLTFKSHSLLLSLSLLLFLLTPILPIKAPCRENAVYSEVSGHAMPPPETHVIAKTWRYVHCVYVISAACRLCRSRSGAESAVG